VPQPGQTLNAVTFANIMQGWHWGEMALSEWCLPLLMLCEAALLLVAANTGFIAGPTVLANMAVDSWVPSQFRLLSSRLVVQNGLWFYGLVSILVLLGTGGKVSVLVILYSINVFITFSLSMFGLCLYWLKHKTEPQWLKKFCLAAVGFLVTSSILIITIVEKFAEGGWITLFITGTLFYICVRIRRRYKSVDRQLQALAVQNYEPNYLRTRFPPPIDPTQPTAVFFVDESIGICMNTVVRVRTLFPDVYKNYIFLGVGEVDAGTYGREAELRKMVHSVNDSLRYFVNYCHNVGLPSTSYCGYGIDTAESLSELADDIKMKYPNCIFFGGEIMFSEEDWVTKILHKDEALGIQRLLHQKGLQTILLPINLSN
jgi:K+ transporter